MLNNIPPSVLNDMDNILEVRESDHTGKKLTAVSDFLESASQHFSQQKFSASDAMMRHEAGILEAGFMSARTIVERIRDTTRRP